MEVHPGRGIVICAGGPYLELALVAVRLLRAQGCRLAVELWHLPGEDTSAAEGLPDGAQLRELPLALPRRRPEVWAVKPLALLASGFQEVLLLDADNVPVCDPEHLFEEPDFRRTGALFWPDFSPFEEKEPHQWHALSGGRWQRRPKQLRWEQESGQLLVDKSRCLRGLWRAASMALRLGVLSPYLPGDGGDKDLFQIAWTLEELSFAMCPLPAAAGVLDPSAGVPGGFVGHTMVQRSCDGRPAFLHRTIDKHEDLTDPRWDLVAAPRTEEQCLVLRRIYPDAKVKVRIVPRRAEDVEVVAFDSYIPQAAQLRAAFARMEKREAEGPTLVGPTLAVSGSRDVP
ncbi:unnamed protein product [Effrenium voratum]|nr:unnamed protein product [Effrenium voratum]